MSLDRDLVAAALPLYEVGAELGRGAWGVVIAGRHRQLGRDVAIKQLPRAFGADPAVRSRFVAEARLLASLDHTHIVPIHDFVEHEGICLLVMDRLTGGTVWNRFQSGAFTPQRSAAVALAAGSALHYAHRRGVLHRDIKPDNLMFSAEGVLKITDFGIAKVLGGSATVATRAGDVLGTPAYMAPEQAQAETLSAATDVYALGTVLYELLAGALPYPEESNPVATLYRHVHEPPRPLTEVASALPRGLALAVSKAIERDVTDRYPDAETFSIAVAAAATDAWGRGWLGETGVVVAASSSVLSAAVGGAHERTADTIVAQRSDVRDGDPSAATTPAGNTVTPGDLVPVNLLRAEFADPAPLVTATPPEAPPPEDRGPASSAGTEEHVARRAPGAVARRLPRWVLASAAAIALALIAVALVMTRDEDGPTRVTARPTVTTTAPAPLPPLQPASWRGLRDAPTPRQQVATAVAGGTIWLFGGLAGDGATGKVEGYDPAIDTWKTGPDLPLPLHHEMAVTYRAELVVLGGWIPQGTNLTALASDKVFALRGGSWVELPRMLRPRAAGAAAVVGDRIVVVGGQLNGELVAPVEIFDGTQWVESAPLPTPREHLAAVSDGRFVYAVGGRALSADKNLGAVERLDLTSRRWTTLPDLPTPRGGLGAAVVGGRIVAAGGESPTGVYDAVELFDPFTNAWSAGPPMRTPRHGLAVASVGSSVYAFGGARQPSHTASTATAEVLEFGAAAASEGPAPVGGAAWRGLRDAPTPRQQLATAVSGGTIWLLGGLTGEGSTGKVEGYDPAINTWKTGPDLPLPLHHPMAVTFRGELVVLGGWIPQGPNLTGISSDKAFALRGGSWVELPHMLRPHAAGAAVVADDRIVVFGGQANGELVSMVEIFDGTRWLDTAPLPTPREHLAAASDGRFVYVIGGRALSADRNLGTVERFDMVARRWTRLPDLPTPRGGLGVAMVGGRIVTVGGESPTGVFGTVELFDPVTNAWSAGPAMRTPRHGLAVASLGSSVFAFGGAREASHTASTATAEALDL